MFDLGFDIGGTKCAAILGDGSGKVLARRAFLTRDMASWREVLDALIAEGVALLDGRALRAVGISCGGPLDYKAGVIQSPPNLPGWDDVPIVNYVEKRLGRPAFLRNDANACALAEWKYGAGRGCDDLIFLTFGTGMGAGLILNGQLYEGACGLAGEVGHMRLSEGGPVGYGKEGSFEGYCSGGGLSRLALLRMGEDLSARELSERAEAGDVRAAEVLFESAERLGQGLALLVDVLNPARIIIGSVFARAEKWFRPGMETALWREALPASAARCQVVPSELGDALGDVAALAVAANGLSERGEGTV